MDKYLTWIVKTILKAGFAPVFVFTFHVLSTRVFGIYQVWPNFDDLMHFSGGVVMAFFFVHALMIGRELKIFSSFTKFSFAISVFSFTSTVTIFWEFLEWLSDFYFGTYMQNSLDDTMLDMFLGMTGAVVVIIISIYIIKDFFIKDSQVR